MWRLPTRHSEAEHLTFHFSQHIDAVFLFLERYSNIISLGVL